MRLNTLILALMLTMLSGCAWLKHHFGPTPVRKEVEYWQDSVASMTTKIRVTSSFSNSELKNYYLERVIKMGFVVAKDKVSHGRLTTNMKRHENYYLRLSLEVMNDTAIWYGQYGSRHLGSYMNGSSDPLSNEISESEIDWKPIEYGSRGWSQLELAAKIDTYTNEGVTYKTEFNRIE